MVDYSDIVNFIDFSNVRQMLAINPRSGDLLHTSIASGVTIDSFVSDDEWTDSAKSFSRNVHVGYSHHPLEAAQNETYDLILVCEDMGYADDCDAMFQEYYRLLKTGGILLGGIWNVSYAESISAFLNGRKVGLKSDLCGYGSIPLDCLISRLDELGFSEIAVHNLLGEADNSSRFAEVSQRNIEAMPEERFRTKIHIISATK